jgi:hypothetical protein
VAHLPPASWTHMRRAAPDLRILASNPAPPRTETKARFLPLNDCLDGSAVDIVRKSFPASFPCRRWLRALARSRSSSRAGLGLDQQRQEIRWLPVIRWPLVDRSHMTEPRRVHLFNHDTRRNAVTPAIYGDTIRKRRTGKRHEVDDR